MANTLITYDVQHTSSVIHTTVRNAMIALGYHEDLTAGSNNITYRLPNTCLWKAGISASQAAADLQNVCRINNAVLEKFIAVEFLSYRIDSDTKS